MRGWPTNLGLPPGAPLGEDSVTADFTSAPHRASVSKLQEGFRKPHKKKIIIKKNKKIKSYFNWSSRKFGFSFQVGTHMIIYLLFLNSLPYFSGWFLQRGRSAPASRQSVRILNL